MDEQYQEYQEYQDYQEYQEYQPPIDRKALSIAIEYLDKDPDEQLHGTHKDPVMIKKLLRDLYNYEDRHITILMDDGNHKRPTRENILHEMHKLVRGAKKGDHLLFHYSGHGDQIPTNDAREADGLDEVLLPVDYERIQDEDGNETYQNHIIDNEIHDILAEHLNSGVHITMVFDSCHSGTVADLQFTTDPTDGGSPIVSSASSMNSKSTLIRQVKVRDKQVVDQTSHAIRHDFLDDTAEVNKSVRARTPGKLAASRHLDDYEQYPDVTSWSACASAETTPESPKRGGLFVQAFTAELRENPDIHAEDLLDRISRRLARRVGKHEKRQVSKHSKEESTSSMDTLVERGPPAIPHPVLGGNHKITRDEEVEL